MKKKQRLSASLTHINLFLPHWKFFFGKMFAPRAVRRLSSEAAAALWGGSGCPASSPGPGVHGCSSDSAWGQKPLSSLDILSLVCLPRDSAAWESGMEGIQAVSWAGMREDLEGEGQEWQGTFLVWESTSGLSRLYQRVINQQSAGLRFGNQSILAQKQPGEKMYLGST